MTIEMYVAIECLYYMYKILGNSSLKSHLYSKTELPLLRISPKQVALRICFILECNIGTTRLSAKHICIKGDRTCDCLESGGLKFKNALTEVFLYSYLWNYIKVDINSKQYRELIGYNTDYEVLLN